MEYVVRATNVTKKFKNHVANDSVNLSIKKGEIYGFIGRNGAGKTTFMKMLCGLTTPTSGEIEIFGATGSDVYEHRYRIGNLIENPGMYEKLTALENLKCKSIALGIHVDNYEQELLDIVGLSEVGKKKVKDFSLGMRQRLGIAMAMVGDPDLLVLDEPINGLDPQGIAEVRDTLLRLRDEKNMTIMISSHILEELKKIADTFCFINKGKILEQLTKDELEAKSADYIRLIVDDTSKTSTILDKLGITKYKAKENNKLHLYEGFERTGEINKTLVMAGITVDEICHVNESLENYFLDLTNEDGSEDK